MRTQSHIELIPIGSIRESSNSRTVHADFDPNGKDAWLVDDIRAHGILLPLLVGPDGALTDGHRRLAVAKLLGHANVPCLILQSTDDAAFRSAQLARQMTIFAKCALYRKPIADLIRRGREQSANNLKMKLGASVADGNVTHQQWIQLESILNVSRRNLTAGVKLLDRLDTMREGDDADQTMLANRVEYVFRNRGIKPALRMLASDEQESDDELGDMEPDCGAWQSWEVGATPRIKTNKRGPSRSARKSNAALREAWLAAAINHLLRFEKLAARHHLLTPPMGEALKVLHRGVAREPLRVA